MANEDGSVKIKVNMDITDVGAGVKDIGGQLKKAGDAAAQAGKAIGKSLSKNKWGYDQGAVDFMENFGKSLAGSAEAARKVMDAYDKAGVSAENAAESVRKLAEEEREAVETGAATVGEEAADTIHKQVLSAQKALAELSEQGLGPGDAKWDEAYQAAAQLHAEEKAYLADLAKTPEQREREAAAIAKAAARAEELRRKEEARADGAADAIGRRVKAAEKALAEISGQGLGAGDDKWDEAYQKLSQLRKEEKAYLADIVKQAAEADKAVEDVWTLDNYDELPSVQMILPQRQEEPEWQLDTGDIDFIKEEQAQVQAAASAWERFRQKILGAAASLGLVRKQTDDTSGAMKRLRSSAGTAASGMGSMFKNMLKWGLGIGSVTMLVRRLWSTVKDGLNIMAQHDAETADTLNGLKAALTSVKLSLATAFAPVVTAVAPLLIKLSDLATKAANAVARFFAILSGKSTYKKAVAAQDAITDSVAGTGAAAKEAAKYLSGLDELNTWQENKAGSGGGGGAGGGTDVDMEEVETGAATDFEVRLKDILFNWDDLNPELIAEKILTGLCAAAGGIIGWTIGGPLGGLVGLTLGALLGVKLSQVTFDGDGKLNKEEISKLIVTAVCGLIGGVLGAMAGGPLGAAIGFTVGAGVSVLIGKALFNNDGKLNKEETTKLIVTAVCGLIGGELGAIAGGPLGAAIGFSIGAGVSVLIGKALFNNDGKLNKEETTKLIVTAVCGLIGGVLGAVAGGPLGAAIGFSIGAGVSVLIGKALFNNDGKLSKTGGEKLILAAVSGMLAGILGFVIGGPGGAIIGFTLAAGITAKIGDVLFNSDEKVTESKLIDSLVEALALIIGGATIGFAVGGPFGAAIGMTIGIALTFAVLGTKWKKGDPDIPGPAGNNSVSDLYEIQKEAEEAIASGEYVPDIKTEWYPEKVTVSVEADIVDVKDSLKEEQKTLQGKWDITGLAPGLGKKDITVPTKAKLDSVIDAIDPKDKEVGGVTGTLNELKAPKDRLTLDASARVTDAEDKIPTNKKTVSGVFKGTSFTNGLKSNPIISTVSKFVSSVLGLSQDQRTITTWAKYTASVLGLNKDQRTITTWAKYTASVLGLNKDQRTITTWAKYTAYILGLSKKQRTITIWAKYTEAILGLSKNQRTITTTAKATSFVDAIKDNTITVKAKISEIVSSAASKVKSWLGLATGGIYKNGRWEPIEGYAAGGSPRSARLFYANENGMPELIGRIGSSTAVMNNGQIVASVAAGVYRAVAAAFSRLGGWFSAMTARLGDIPPAIEMLANMPRQIPQPVMATGTVLPPRAVYADGPVQGLADAVSNLRDALDRQSPDRSGTRQEPTYNVNLNVDGQTLCRIVLREGRLRQLQSGGNPFMDLMGG